MIGFLFGPIGRYFMGGALIIAIVGGIYWKGHSDGKSGIEAEIANRKASEIEAAREIERDAAPCNADPECVQPDPFRLRVPSVRPDPGK